MDKDDRGSVPDYKYMLGLGLAAILIIIFFYSIMIYM